MVNEEGAKRPERSDDPKAQEYANTLISISLLQAKVDKLEEDSKNQTAFIADLYVLLTGVAKAVQVLQRRGNRK